jgi:MOSC domain-containing protein YiiM
MVTHPRCEVTSASGLAGDSRGRPGRRQVTVLTREGWAAACARLGDDPGWTTRRANLLVEGVTLEGVVGARLRIGPLVLEVTEECDPCRVMDRAASGLRRALEPSWAGGVCCRVEQGGTISVGDSVFLEDPRTG